MEDNIYTIEYILENNIDKTAYGFIYITTNLINGKKYIGLKTFDKRWKKYLGSGKILKIAIKKYGKENFHRNIFSVSRAREELDNSEIEFIKKYNAVEDDNYYNLADGGHGCVHNKETRKKLSILRTGSRLSEETKMRIGKAGKGRIVSEKTKHKSSVSNRGQTRSKETKQNISDACKGRIPYNKGIKGVAKQSDETKLKISNMTKGANNPRARQVICTTTMKIFLTLKDGAMFYKFSSSGINQNLSDKQKSAGKLEDGTKLVWMYYEDYLKLQVI